MCNEAPAITSAARRRSPSARRQLRGDDHRLPASRRSRGAARAAGRRDVGGQRRRHRHAERHAGRRDRRHLRVDVHREQRRRHRRASRPSRSTVSGAPAFTSAAADDLHGRAAPGRSRSPTVGTPDGGDHHLAGAVPSGRDVRGQRQRHRHAQRDAGRRHGRHAMRSRSRRRTACCRAATQAFTLTVNAGARDHERRQRPRSRSARRHRSR